MRESEIALENQQYSETMQGLKDEEAQLQENIRHNSELLSINDNERMYQEKLEISNSNYPLVGLK